MRITFDTNTLDPITLPELAGSLREACTVIHESLKSRRLTGFFCETVLTLEGGEEETAARVKRAVDLGMRILEAPRVGGVRIADPSGELYAKDTDEGALANRLMRFESIAAAIEARGLGHARLLKVARSLDRGVGFESGRADIIRASSPRDRRKVARAVAEWADGDSVSAHYAYANDLFCTEDRAAKAGRDSVMHPAQRDWLQRTYGIEIVSIAELAARI